MLPQCCRGMSSSLSSSYRVRDGPMRRIFVQGLKTSLQRAPPVSGYTYCPQLRLRSFSALQGMLRQRWYAVSVPVPLHACKRYMVSPTYACRRSRRSDTRHRNKLRRHRRGRCQYQRQGAQRCPGKSGARLLCLLACTLSPAT